MVEGFLKRKSGSSRRNCRLVQLEIVVKSSGPSMGFSHQPPSNFMADFENPVTSCVANPQKNLPRNMKDFSEGKIQRFSKGVCAFPQTHWSLLLSQPLANSIPCLKAGVGKRNNDMLMNNIDAISNYQS